MKAPLSASSLDPAQINQREMAAGLQKILQKKYSRVLCAAAAEWERRFLGKEPSDACVSVRISARRHAAIAEFCSQAA